MYNFLKIFFEKQRERQRQRSPTLAYSESICQQLGMGHVEATSLEPNLGLPICGRDPNTCVNTCCLLGSALTGS